MGVQAVGLGAVVSQLRAASDAIGDPTEANREAAAFVADRARAQLPRRTGALSQSVTIDADASGAVVSVGTRYARPVLFGAPRAGTPAARNTPYSIMLANLSALTDLYRQHAADACKLVKG